MIPVEVKRDDRRLPLWCPSAYPGGAFADAGLVCENDQSAFSLGYFEGKPSAAFKTAYGRPVALDGALLRLLHAKTQSTERRQIGVWPNLTWYRRFLTILTRLSGRRSRGRDCASIPPHFQPRLLDAYVDFHNPKPSFNRDALRHARQMRWQTLAALRHAKTIRAAAVPQSQFDKP